MLLFGWGDDRRREYGTDNALEIYLLDDNQLRAAWLAHQPAIIAEARALGVIPWAATYFSADDSQS